MTALDETSGCKLRVTEQPETETEHWIETREKHAIFKRHRKTAKRRLADEPQPLRRVPQGHTLRGLQLGSNMVDRDSVISTSIDVYLGRSPQTADHENVTE